jgi:hypothetical protein
MPLNISISTQVAITDYPVKIDLSQAPLSFWNNVIDGTDIYFLDSNGNPLYYFIEYIDKINKKGVAWVKITLSANSSTTIQMYFGGSNPYSSYNDPYKIFLFFEDFENSRDPNWISNRNPSFDTFAVANYVDPEPTVSIYELAPSYQTEDQDYISVLAPSYQLEDQDYLLISAPSYQLEDQDYISVSGVTYQLEDQDYISISAVSYRLEDQDYVSISLPPPSPPTPTCLEFQDILSQEGYSWEKAIASILCGLEAVLTELGNEVSRSAKTISLVFIGIGFGYALMRIGEKIIMLILRGLRKSYEKKR